MITLNKNTKKAKAFIEAFMRAKREGNTSLYSIYARPSAIKLNIARAIENKAGDARVYYMGGNSFNFTCGYFDDRFAFALFIETKNNTYKIPM